MITLLHTGVTGVPRDTHDVSSFVTWCLSSKGRGWVTQMSWEIPALLAWPPRIECNTFLLLHTEELHVYLSSGGSTWAFYPSKILDGQNIHGFAPSDVPTCLDACRAEPTFASVDYKENNQKCFFNDVRGMHKVLTNFPLWLTANLKMYFITKFGIPCYIPQNL